MESVLVLLCMIFFIILIRGFIAGVNLNKNNLIKCRRIYVPQDINLETAFNSLINKNLDGLKKRARELGATKKYIDELGNELNNELNTEIDKEKKTVSTESNETFPYDKLVLATGSYPFVPPIPGNDQEHCLVYRTIEDLQAISASAKVSKTGVVVGGGWCACGEVCLQWS